ncbi:MAG: hypothetical protein ACR5LG_02310 [Sodalis sp. (in: enterobacteria)]
MLTDIYGRLLRRRTLTQPQTADDRRLRYQQLAEHPSLGIDIRRVHDILSEAEQGIWCARLTCFLIWRSATATCLPR